MAVKKYMRLAARLWPALLAIVLLSTAVGGVIGAVTKQQYQSTAGLIFNVGEASSAVELAQASIYLDQVMTSYSALSTTPYVLDPVIEKLGLKESAADLAPQISALNPSKTVLLDVTVTRKDPETAAKIANAVAEQMVKSVKTTAPSPTSSRVPLLKAEVIVKAVPAPSPTGLGLMAMLGAGFFVGVLVALAFLVYRAKTDATIKRPTELAESGSGLVGHIGYSSDGAVGLEGMKDATAGSFGEQMRITRDVLLAEWDIESGPPKRAATPCSKVPRTLLVTSNLAGEGKSTVALGLAQALSTIGAKVLVIDANLRHPDVSRSCASQDSAGMLDAISGVWGLAELTKPLPGTDIDVIPIGDQSRGRFEQLSDSELFTGLPHDYVIIDGPELSGVSDGDSLASVCSGTLLVVQANRSNLTDVTEATKRVQLASRGPVWTVLNQVDRAEMR